MPALQLGPRTLGILNPALAPPSFCTVWREPDPRLEPFIESHWCLTWQFREGASYSRETLRHPCEHIVTREGETTIWGVRRERAKIDMVRSGKVLGTRFYPGAFAAISQTRPSEWRDGSTTLSKVFGPRGKTLEGHLASIGDDEGAHYVAVETFLLDQDLEPDQRYDLIRAATDLLRYADPGWTVADVAAACGVSVRTLQRAFNDYVGLGPKWILRRYRILNAAERIARAQYTDVVSIALEFGYFDQAHFAHDFRSQIGCSPRTYARACKHALQGRDLDYAGRWESRPVR